MVVQEFLDCQQTNKIQINEAKLKNHFSINMIIYSNSSELYNKKKKQ